MCVGVCFGCAVSRCVALRSACVAFRVGCVLCVLVLFDLCCFVYGLFCVCWCDWFVLVCGDVMRCDVMWCDVFCVVLSFVPLRCVVLDCDV